MKFFSPVVMDIFLDVVDDPWIVEHGSEVVILSVLALIALAVIVYIFIRNKKKKKIK